MGVNIYLWREEFLPAPDWPWPLDRNRAGVGLRSVQPDSGRFPGGIFTIYLGIANPRRIALLKSADLSYGIFLYHFAIMQTVVYFAGGSLPFLWTS